MSLPASWVDRLFAKLSVTYGQRFLRQYDGVDMALVKANWAEELACFSQNPDALRRGLELLPEDHAPTVLEFRSLCKTTGPAYRPLELPAPRDDGPVDPSVIAAMRGIAAPKPEERDMKGWARKLKAREEAGERLSSFQRRCWREALGETPSVKEAA